MRFRIRRQQTLREVQISGPAGMQSGQTLLPDGQKQIQLQLPALTGPIQVSFAAESAGMGGTRHELTLTIQPWRDLSELEGAEAALDRGRRAEARKLLEEALQRYSGSSAQRARVLLARADVAGEQKDGAVRQVEDFTESLRLARDAGLLSIAANAARRLAMIHFQYERDLDTTERILGENQETIDQIADEAGLALYDRGLVAQERGQLTTAESWLARARRYEESAPLPETKHLILVQLAFIHAQQGRVAETEAAIKAYKSLADSQEAFEPCERQRGFNTLAWARLLAAEARDRAAGDPTELLQLAEDSGRKEGCDEGYSAAHVEVNRARAELLQAEKLAEQQTLAGEPVSADGLLRCMEGHLQRASTLAPSPSRALRLDQTEIAGRLALLAKDPGKALQSFTTLARDAGDAQDPDYLWRALIGQALSNAGLAQKEPARAREYEQAATAAFDRAEASIDERMWVVPLSVGRRSFAVRFMLGTSEYLDFLLRRGREDDALRVARRAHVRGLITTLAFDLLWTLPEPLQEELSAKRQAFLELSSVAQEDADRDGASSQQLLARLNDLLQRLKAAGLSRLELRPLKPGELTFVCHPLPAGRVVCFAATAERTRQIQITQAELDKAKAGNPSALAKLLIDPFAEMIDAANTVRILPSALLRRINFAALEWPHAGQYLASERRRVVYALDLELGQRASLVRPGHALLLANLELQPAARSAQELFGTLQKRGWDVSVYTNLPIERGFNLSRSLRCLLGGCPQPIDLPIRLAPGRASEVMGALPFASLAHLYTHAKYASESGWLSYIVMPDRSQISVGEFLTLRGVPRFTVLDVCQGGQAGEEEQQADDISLAQAILLRGGEAVVASVTKLPTQVGADWGAALYDTQASSDGAEFLRAESFDLPSAHSAAVRRMQHEGKAPPVWSALHLFVH